MCISWEHQMSDQVTISQLVLFLGASGLRGGAKYHFFQYGLIAILRLRKFKPNTFFGAVGTQITWKLNFF